MKIKKSVIKQILDAYSISPNEFELTTSVNHSYRSKRIKDYHLLIELEKELVLNAEGTNIASAKETGRIVVHHTDSRGKRVFNDVWVPDGNGSYYWFCRNSAKEPLTDYNII